jgi:hypothetical protein
MTLSVAMPFGSRRAAAKPAPAKAAITSAAASGLPTASRPSPAPMARATITMKISKAILSASPNSMTTRSFAPGGWMSTMNRAMARSGEGAPRMPAASSPAPSAAPTATAPANNALLDPGRESVLPPSHSRPRNATPLTRAAYVTFHDATLTRASRVRFPS